MPCETQTPVGHRSPREEMKRGAGRRERGHHQSMNHKHTQENTYHFYTTALICDNVALNWPLEII